MWPWRRRDSAQGRVPRAHSHVRGNTCEPTERHHSHTLAPAIPAQPSNSHRPRPTSESGSGSAAEKYSTMAASRRLLPGATWVESRTPRCVPRPGHPRLTLEIPPPRPKERKWRQLSTRKVPNYGSVAAATLPPGPCGLQRAPGAPRPSRRFRVWGGAPPGSRARAPRTPWTRTPAGPCPSSPPPPTTRVAQNNHSPVSKWMNEIGPEKVLVHAHTTAWSNPPRSESARILWHEHPP